MRPAVGLVLGLLALAGAAQAQALPGAAPRTLYVLHCAGCHGLEGSGQPAKGVPSMRGALGAFLRLPEGRAFLVQVPGVNNAGLGDEQIARVTNWTLEQFSADTLSAGWRPFDAAEVAAARRGRPADIAQRRATIVAELRRLGWWPG